MQHAGPSDDSHGLEQEFDILVQGGRMRVGQIRERYESIEQPVV